jgi:hypothetical protein
MAVLALGGLLSTYIFSSANSASGAGTPASFSGGCKTPPAIGSLSVTQMGSYDRILSGARGSVEAINASQWPGHCAIGITVRAGDSTGDSAVTNRTEIAAPHTEWYADESVWYAFSFQMTSGSPLPRAGSWMLVDQFFAQDFSKGISGGAPPLSLEVTPKGQIRIHIRAGAKLSAGEQAPRNRSYFLAPIKRGVWHDLLIHVRWSSTATGLVNVWQRTSNGTFTSAPQVSAGGPDVLSVSGDTLPVYAETGIYRSVAPTTQTVHYGGLWARPDRAEAEAFFANSPT